jgi:tRNA threonylcarbamoyl adenosine modification protein (Sua5/YciO/YrdC/YwlC family)
MEILSIDPVHPQPVLITKAVAVLRRGLPAAFPTDTVYGLGIAVVANSSPESLFALKRRDATKTIPWLIADVRALDRYGKDVPTWAYEMVRAHWPGALTLVVRASSAVPSSFCAPDGTVALRAPAHPLVLALIEALGAPLATTSANLQGNQPATSCATLDPRLAKQLALVIDGGATPGVLPSTIISCLERQPRILREGVLPAALLLH